MMSYTRRSDLNRFVEGFYGMPDRAVSLPNKHAIEIFA